jgi:hypothetical protein
MTEGHPDIPPICPYCSNQSVQVGGLKLYPHREDLASKTFYLCEPCDAFVGTHKGTNKPLGTLANKPLREIRKLAHATFDPLWKDGQYGRGEAYRRLAKAMGITREDCHIAMFSIEQCKSVIQVVNSNEIHRLI